MSTVPTHAIVIGGSIAGMLAARVLTNHFDKVTIVEKDTIPENPDMRPGVPQSLHVHVLLTKGQQILEKLFPGIQQELANKGTPTIHWTRDCPFVTPSGLAPRVTSDLITNPSSRNLLEKIIRQRLLKDRKVEFLLASQAICLLSNPDNTTVIGIQVSKKSEASNFAYAHNHEDDNRKININIKADLVVDASGRNSQAAKWLKIMGYNPPQQTVINSFLGYASRWYQLPGDKTLSNKAMMVSAKPPVIKRGGVLYPIEDNKFVLTLAGIAKDYPPTDEQSFLDFTSSLRHPMIYEAIKDAHPISPIYSYRRTENRWNHYEKLSRFPDNFILVGDAVCAFNPVYGQGMTTAALSALTLDASLQKELQSRKVSNLKGFSRRFQKQLSKVISDPWLMATSEDFRWEITEGGKPSLITKWMYLYMDKVISQMAIDSDIYKSFSEVMHMVQPPSYLLQPTVMLRVLKNSFPQKKLVGK